jgi:hypothetical protein
MGLADYYLIIAVVLFAVVIGVGWYVKYRNHQE